MASTRIYILLLLLLKLFYGLEAVVKVDCLYPAAGCIFFPQSQRCEDTCSPQGGTCDPACTKCTFGAAGRLCDCDFGLPGAKDNINGLCKDVGCAKRGGVCTTYLGDLANRRPHVLCACRYPKDPPPKIKTYAPTKAPTDNPTPAPTDNPTPAPTDNPTKPCDDNNADIGKKCYSNDDCLDCLQCCPKYKVCEIPPAAKSMLIQHDINDDKHEFFEPKIEEKKRFYEYPTFGYISYAGFIAFIVINNALIGYWCCFKRNNDNNKYEKCDMITVNEE